jgi:diguanylate cyclase (GGDEF)-like protein
VQYDGQVRGRPESIALAVAMTVAVVAAATVVLLAAVGAPLAPAVAVTLAGGLPLVAALLLWPLPALRGTRVPAYRRWFAAALAVWGCGALAHLAVRGIARAGPASFPTPADVASLLTAPLVVVGLVLFSRAVPGLTGFALPAARLFSDAMLLGLSLALVVWRFGVQGTVTGGPGATSVAVLELLADLVVGCMAALIALRQPTRPVLVAATGLGMVVVGHVLVLRAGLSPSGGWSVPGAALLVAGWPLVAAGMLSHRPPALRFDDGDLDGETRLTAVTTTGTLVVLGVGVLGILLRPPVDEVSLWLVFVLIVVVWVREMIATGQRAGLLKRLHSEATLDPLTGLANRRQLTRRLAAVDPRQAWCLLTLDLDAFKTVNDVLGHDTGDQLLRAVARRLVEVVPPRSLVARIGGDEFAVLLPATPAAAQRLGEGLVAAVRRASADVPGVDRVGVSAGVGISAVEAVQASPDGSDPQTPDAVGPRPDPLSALSAAGAAQQLAKAAGRDHVQLYDTGAATLRRRRLRMEERLRVAVAEGGLQVHYQPIVELAGGRLIGLEALARWVDDELGAVPPEEFIAVAEESGLVVPLGELVLHEAMRAAVAAGLPAAGVRISCNVSPLQLRVPGFHRVVEGALAAHRMPASAVVVEVTEAVLVEEQGVAATTLQKLVDMGVTVAIDDFGTGYSALGYLRRLPAQVLKIDKSLTSSLMEEPRARAIVRAVTELGRSIGLSVVVEGVETTEVAELVGAMGADFGQGSLFGQAGPLADVPGLRKALTRARPAPIVTLPEPATGPPTPAPAPRRG